MTSDSYVMTVRGPVSPEAIGFTLPHEHIYIQLSEIHARFDYPFLLDDDEVLAEELGYFTASGGTTVVELTLADMGRDPERLRSISERTGLNIVMGSGWYRQPYYRPQDLLEKRPVRDLAESLVREIREGADGTGIRPGVIGEIGVHRGWVTPIEERAHRAAARAQVATGLPMITHSTSSQVAREQLTIFEDEGVDLTRVVVGHADSYPHLWYYLELIERGASLAFDNIGEQAGRLEERIAGLTRDLVDRGHADRIMLSQDICKHPQLRYHGGQGYAYVAERFLPRLRGMGIPESVIRQITEGNPRRWLTIPGGTD